MYFPERLLKKSKNALFFLAKQDILLMLERCQKIEKGQKKDFYMVNNALHNKMSEQIKGCMKPYRVLSLDGGGMRGLYTASVLKSLSERFCESSKKDIGKGFDLIVGTSTGGILATGLVAGIPIDEIMDIYYTKGRDIFTNPKPNSLKKYWWALKALRKPANSNVSLQKALNRIFKNETVGDVYMRRGIGLCIPAVKLVDCSPRVFKTPHNPEKHADNKRNLVDICLATSAAPIIFPVVSIPEPSLKKTQEHFIDGGLWANNPTLIGLIEALELSEKDQKIEIISIGTCPVFSGETLNEKSLNRGIADWNYGVDIFDLSGNAQSRSVDFICKFLEKNLKKLGKQVHIYRLPQKHLSPAQEKTIGLDKSSQEACDTLMVLGIEDGKQIYGDCYNNPNDENLKILKNIFINLTDLPKGGKNG